MKEAVPGFRMPTSVFLISQAAAAQLQVGSAPSRLT